MRDRSGLLFVTRYYWPELIGSAPFSTDIAEWLTSHGRETIVVAGLSHYPDTVVFSDYRESRRPRETVGGVEVERLRAGPPRGSSSALSRVANEAEFLLRGLAALASGRIRRHSVMLALCPSMRRSGAFLCVPPGDPPGFAQAVIELADDSRLRRELGRRGREFVEQHYAKARVLGHLMSRLDAFAPAG